MYILLPIQNEIQMVRTSHQKTQAEPINIDKTIIVIYIMINDDLSPFDGTRHIDIR